MNAQAFLELVNKADNLDNADLKVALKLQEEFPYFLAPKVLAAKYEWDKASGESKTLLHWAAVVSPDRKWLKSLLTGASPIVSVPPLSEAAEKAVPENIPDEQNGPQTLENEINPTPVDETAPEHISRPKRDEILRRLEENLKKIKKPRSPNQDESENSKKKDTSEKTNEVSEDTIDETKNKPKDSSDKKAKKAHQKLIDDFEEKPIRLAREKMDESLDLPDLSEKSTNLNHSMLSESYAKLLVKQNKNREAIEIYQKLILNFPKKKAYFVDQIENLKE